MVKNIDHSYCTSSGNHLGLLIETGSTKKKERCHKLSFAFFEAVDEGGVKHSQN